MSTQNAGLRIELGRRRIIPQLPDKRSGYTLKIWLNHMSGGIGKIFYSVLVLCGKESKYSRRGN